MSEVTVSERLRALYNQATGRTGSATVAASPVKRVAKRSLAPSLSTQVPSVMPVKSMRFKRPGGRAVDFNGALLCSAQSDGRTAKGYFRLEIYQNTNETFLTRIDRIDHSGTARLVLTIEAVTIAQLRDQLDLVDPAKYVPLTVIGDNAGDDLQAGSTLRNIANTLAETRAEYADLILSVFPAGQYASNRAVANEQTQYE